VTLRLTRRDFLRLGLLASAGAGFYSAKDLLASTGGGTRWVFLVDTYKCVGCGLCVRACKLENEIPYEANVTRTWVERYVQKKDGTVVADSPIGARDGYTRNDPQGAAVPEDEIAKAFFVPKLCNQCDKPPCVQVCPVGATYRAPDGVVLVDRKWCIGCGYCIMACPYGVRFFHPVYKVAEKCNFCYHRISRGMKPACVLACPFGARRIGNMKDPEDPVAGTIKTERVHVLRPELGSDPQVYYVGFDNIIR
jgi:Fe-S-cluster-containing dehydrogenase component